MVQYDGLRLWKNGKARNRLIDRLLALREGLAKDVTTKDKLQSFHLASWNIRDFGACKFNPCPRRPESLLYIAEILSAFDLIAIQEVNENMAEFEKVMLLLGPRWNYVVTDQSGNQERLAFVFDTRKIQFRHVTGEIVLPPREGIQFNRTPFLVAFQAGWLRLNICTVHILYGDQSNTAARQREIGEIAKFFSERQKRDRETYVLIGDFNILRPDDENMAALLRGGFKVPPKLSKTTDLGEAHYYDQIAVCERTHEVEIENAGVFRWKDYVFRDDADYKDYKPLLPTRTKSGKPEIVDVAAYKKWRTWQMSDHMPLWAEIRIDFTEQYLDSLRPGAQPLAKFPPGPELLPDDDAIGEPGQQATEAGLRA
jgi:endonuclease/exonuclease/phosphatase family metal-dependent hydrolase